MSQALVLAGHGSQRHRGSADPLHAHADRIRDSGAFDEVRTAFWKEEPTLRDVRSIVESDLAFVVPVLTSEGYFANEVFPRELRVADADDGTVERPTIGDRQAGEGTEVRFAEPVGTHDALTAVIEARVESAIEGPPSSAGVALVGHGTERHERSADSTVEHARRLRERSSCREIEALFLDESPHVGELYDRLDARELVVVPLFVADGYHTTRDVPAAIDHPGVRESVEVEGRLVHYAGAVGTEPSLADVIVERAAEAGASVEPGSSRDELTEAGDDLTATGQAFVRYVNSRSSRTAWGELSIARRSSGYELRHREDVERGRERLRSLDRPRDLREAVRTDDDGRYRPLSGAETLPTGWVLDGLDATALVRAVEFVYPASIAHWHDERAGGLDVIHFEETVARQTGLYADLDGFDGPALDAAAEAVCGDCVRRRCWEARPDDAIEADPGGGTIPCREACPFFLSAAHAFDEALGRSGVDPDRPADTEVAAGALEEPNNRYRVRFARAFSSRSEVEPPAAPTGGER